MAGVLRLLKIAAALAAIVFALVYVDLHLRARSAFLEGEKYMAWHAHPEQKAAFYNQRFAREKRALELDKADGKIGAAELRQRLELEAFRRDEAVRESSLKYAYHWYKTVVELFAPPESRWVRLSRRKMAAAKALWKAELDAQKIPYEDYMLE